jgi:hypothetical protein
MNRCRNISALLWALASYLMKTPAERAAWRREIGYL